MGNSDRHFCYRLKKKSNASQLWDGRKTNFILWKPTKQYWHSRRADLLKSMNWKVRKLCPSVVFKTPHVKRVWRNICPLDRPNEAIILAGSCLIWNEIKTNAFTWQLDSSNFVQSSTEIEIVKGLLLCAAWHVLIFWQTVSFEGSV